jgi:acyl-coenzyme A thioesterase PaaI-like protein
MSEQFQASTQSGAPTATGQATAVAEAIVQPAVLSYSDFRITPHHCFACGELNEIGLHLKLNLEHGRCWTELELPRRFEGWEGLVHGGIICTILDEVMAWSLVSEDNWGVTARMSIDFKKPLLVGQAIRAEGWITESRRRVHETGARIVDTKTGEELATATAKYVAATDSRKRELKERYGVTGGSAK